VKLKLKVAFSRQVSVLPKLYQNMPEYPRLCWGDEWPTLSPGACLREAASAKAGERVRVRGNNLIITPTLILPHQGGGKFFTELDAPQLCCWLFH